MLRAPATCVRAPDGRHRGERLCSDLATSVALGRGQARRGRGQEGARPGGGGAKSSSIGIYVGKPGFLGFFGLPGLETWKGNVHLCTDEVDRFLSNLYNLLNYSHGPNY